LVIRWKFQGREKGEEAESDAITKGLRRMRRSNSIKGRNRGGNGSNFVKSIMFRNEIEPTGAVRLNSTYQRGKEVVVPSGLIKGGTWSVA